MRNPDFQIQTKIENYRLWSVNLSLCFPFLGCGWWRATMRGWQARRGSVKRNSNRTVLPACTRTTLVLASDDKGAVRYGGVFLIGGD